MKRFIDYIGSRRFAVRILLITTTIIFLSNLLPKPYILTEKEMVQLKRDRPLIHYLSRRFNVAEVTKSPYFILMTTFLFSSILVCTIRRGKRGIEEMEKGLTIPDTGMLHIRHSFNITEEADIEGVGRLLTNRRWLWVGKEIDKGRVVYSRKGERGFWGSISFHAGMCMVLTGAFISAQTSFYGRIVLTEGFDTDPARELKRLSENDRYVFPIRKIMLGSFKPLYRDGFPLDYAAEIVNLDNNGREYLETVRVNEPMRAGGYQFLLGKYGFAPRLVLKDGTGKVISDDIINLVVFNPEQEDSFPLLDREVKAKVHFYPDFYINMEEGRPATRSRIPKNPVFAISIERKGGSIDAGFVKLGDSIGFEGYTLEFRDLRYWVQLDVSRDSGVPVITAGFFVIILGLFLRLLLNEKVVWIIITGQKIGIGGRASFFPALFEEELMRLAEEIRVVMMDEG